MDVCHISTEPRRFGAKRDSHWDVSSSGNKNVYFSSKIAWRISFSCLTCIIPSYIIHTEKCVRENAKYVFYWNFVPVATSFVFIFGFPNVFTSESMYESKGIVAYQIKLMTLSEDYDPDQEHRWHRRAVEIEIDDYMRCAEWAEFINHLYEML